MGIQHFIYHAVPLPHADNVKGNSCREPFHKSPSGKLFFLLNRLHGNHRPVYFYDRIFRYAIYFAVGALSDFLSALRTDLPVLHMPLPKRPAEAGLSYVISFSYKEYCFCR